MTLNQLLDKTTALTPPNALKEYLSKNIIPILEGTALDNRQSTPTVRTSLGQILRDASFAATVLGAAPQGRFVRSIVECIKHDSQRMRFIHRMTSAQASKTIEHLARVGVRSEVIYPVLVSKLDYRNLREVSRVCFALSEAGMHELVTNAVVPLYNNERWSRESEVNLTSKERPTKSTPYVFEAVRIIRILSKSTRTIVESQRLQAHSTYVVPYEGVNELRNNLLEYIVEDQESMRGAHWVNLARALAYFPKECQHMTSLQDHLVLQRELRSLRGKQCPLSIARLTSADVALLALQKLFSPLEGVSQPDDVPTALDITCNDMTKLLAFIQNVPGQDVTVQRQRVTWLVDGISTSMKKMPFSDLVQLLQVLRRMDLKVDGVLYNPIEAVLQEAGNRLVEEDPAKVLQHIQFSRITVFASIIATLRVASCPGFVAFMERAADRFPTELSPDVTAVYLNALTVCTPVLSPPLQQSVILLSQRVVNYTKRNLSDTTSGECFAAWPLPCAKVLRAMVLMDVIPSEALLEVMFGNGSTLAKSTIAEPLRLAGASVIFNVSRSLTHFCRLAREKQDFDIVEALWERCAASTLLPLLLTYSTALAHNVLSSGQRVNSYEPIACRTTMEMLTGFLDSRVESISFECVAQKLRETFQLCTKVLECLISVTDAENRSLRALSRSKGDLHQRVSGIPFASNCALHMLCSLLMYENIIMQWSAKAQQLKTSGEAPPRTLQLAESVVKLKEEYGEFLRRPLPHSSMSPVDVVLAVLGDASDVSTAGAPLLQKEGVLEVTTHLPFAVSLVMHPGPVNEIFSEKCVPIILSTNP